MSDLCASYVVSILEEKLQLKKACARWIPHLLTPDQKRERLKKKTSDIFTMFKNRDPRRLREIDTGDEKWL